MKTVCKVYDSYGQARATVDALENAGVPDSDISIVANKYVSAEHADVDEVSGAAKGAGIGGAEIAQLVVFAKRSVEGLE